MSKVRADLFTNRTSDGAPDFPYGLQTVGIITAAGFSGSFEASGLTGTPSIDVTNVNATGVVTATSIDVANVNATGVVTATSITVTNITSSGNVSIAGTLTYEDVTNIDSVGLITARSGINVVSGGINASGVITASNGLRGIGIHSSGTVIHNGTITALNFVGTGNTFSVDGTTVNISISGSGGEGFSQLDTWLFAP